MSFHFNQKKGSFSFSPSKIRDSGIKDVCLYLETGKKTFYSQHAENIWIESANASKNKEYKQTTIVKLHCKDPELEWNIKYRITEDENCMLISSNIINNSAKDICLGRCCLLHVDDKNGSVLLGKNNLEIVFLDCKASVAATVVKKLSDLKEPHTTNTIAHFYNPRTPAAMHFGFVTFDRIHSMHTFTRMAGKGIGEFSAYCDFAGYELKPGASVASERLMVEMRHDPFISLENWANRVKEYYKPRIRKKITVGWVGMSWVDHFRVERHQRVVFENAQAIRKRLPGFGIDYIWVSITNIKDGLPGNWLEFDNKNFPGGLNHLVKKLSKLRFKLGFWVAPFWICSNLKEQIKDLKNALLKKDNKLMVMRRIWPWGICAEMPVKKRPCVYGLDGSHPKTVGFLKKYLLPIGNGGSGIS